LVENQTGRKVKVLKSDNGGEYTSKEFKDYLVRKGIKHQLSILGRPEQNRVTERMNRTLIERARSIGLQADMSEKFLGRDGESCELSGKHITINRY